MAKRKIRSFGTVLHQLRTDANLSAKKLAERSRLHWVTIYRLESDTYRPSWQAALRLAKALGVSVAVFEQG